MARRYDADPITGWEPSIYPCNHRQLFLESLSLEGVGYVQSSRHCVATSKRARRFDDINSDFDVDGGVENYNTSVDTIVDEGLLKRVLAQTEISFSNSMIESFWKAMKHQWLYLNTLGSATDIQNLVSFYISEHNTKLPHSAFKGQTPDEMYFGTGAEIPDQLTASRVAAQQQRLQSNRAQSCRTCESSASLSA